MLNDAGYAAWQIGWFCFSQPRSLRAARSVADAVKINFTEPLRPFTVVPAKEGVEFVQLITPIRTF